MRDFISPLTPPPQKARSRNVHPISIPDQRISPSFVKDVEVTRRAGGNGAPGVSRTPGTRFRKPLLYPSELRGHERATVCDCFNFRKAPLALSKVPAIALATVLATVSASSLVAVNQVASSPSPSMY